MKRPRQFSLAGALGVVLVVGALAPSALAQTERTASELGQAVVEPGEPFAQTERTASELGQAVGEPGGHVPLVAAATPVIASTSSDGFDWGDAAIGAGSALGLVALVGFGGLALVRRPQARGARV
jgi:hypothetical protein